MQTAQDLRAVVRDFKASVAADLSGIHGRLDHVSDEVRGRFRILETAVLNELRALSRRFDQRANRVDTRLDSLDRRIDDLAASLARIEDALRGSPSS